jgi:hypothetical protein
LQLLILRCTFVLLCFATTRISFAQEDSTEHCATDLRHRALLNADPGYAERFGALENQVNTVMGQIQTNDLNSSQGLIMGDTLEIPIVVHVIHSGQALGVGANISDSQIIYAVEALNDRYRMTAGTWGASGNGIDTEIQFVLAKRDPDCNSSNGIVRVNGSGVTDYSNEGLSVGLGAGADELEIKDLSRWPATDYLNVWVVTEIENNNGGGGIQGYAYFPGVSRLLDGLVIMHTAFGVTGTVNSWNNNNRTFAHEVGHYFSLYHTFEGDSNAASCPPTNNGCGTGLGDCCADIEPHIRAASNCPSGTNPCTSTSWGDAPTNYMNYSSQTCANMFSADQSDRMRASLLGARHSLLSSLGGVAPSGAAVASAACTPSSTSTANGFPMGIINLSFEGLDVTTSFAHPDSGYVDMSCTQQTDVYPSTTYSIDINTGLYYNQDVRVYMDYNNDGDFLDTLELAFSNNSSTTHSGNITIPANPTLNTPIHNTGKPRIIQFTCAARSPQAFLAPT